MNNKNIGCLGWGIIIFAILFAITYWQIALVFIAIIIVIWWYRTRSPQAKERQQEQRVARQEAEKERENNLVRYQNDDLKTLATKNNIIHLKPKEYIYFVENSTVSWIEQRQKTTRINYGGVTGNFKIIKGIHYRTGSIKTDAQKANYFKTIFEGAPLLTNRRIVLYNTNTKTAKAYPYTRLLTATAYSDGTLLSSESGKKVVLTGFNNPDKFNVYLQRLSGDENDLPAKQK